MDTETFDLQGLADYLRRDSRELEKLANRDRIPGRKIGGEWKFNRAEINDWLERELEHFSDAELEDVEVGAGGRARRIEESEFRLWRMMSEETTAVPLDARTAPKVLGQLVDVANGSWQVYVPEKVLAAVRAREALHTTALPGGVAIPHPRRPMPDDLSDSLVAYGRTTTGIPFGGPSGQLTDLFFLVLCQDDHRHLLTLARLVRLFQKEDFLPRLREAQTTAESLELIRETEEQVVEQG